MSQIKNKIHIVTLSVQKCQNKVCFRYIVKKWNKETNWQDTQIKLHTSFLFIFSAQYEHKISSQKWENGLKMNN